MSQAYSIEITADDKATPAFGALSKSLEEAGRQTSGLGLAQNELTSYIGGAIDANRDLIDTLDYYGPAAGLIKAVASQAGVMGAALGSVGLAASKGLGGLNIFLDPLGASIDMVTGQVRIFEDAARGAIKTGLTLVAVGAGLTAIDYLPIQKGREFRKEMSEVQAILSDITQVELGAMIDMAQKMGADTQYSAVQAADAYEFLAMAGLDARESIGALPKTLELAAAGKLELAKAADLATNVLSGMEMQVEELGRVNDVLALTASRANTSVGELGDALVTAGPAANAAGMEIEGVVAVLGGLANAGFKGALAGTAYRQMLVGLINPGEEAREVLQRLGVRVNDTAGNFRGLIPVLEDFATAELGLGDAAKIFGQEAAAAAVAATGQARVIAALEQSLHRADGAAGKMAVTMQDNLEGALTRLSSATEGFWLKIGLPLEEGFKGTIDMVTGWVGTLNEAVDATGILGSVVLDVVGYVGAFVLVIGALNIALGGATIAWAKLTAATRIYNFILKLLGFEIKAGAAVMRLFGVQIDLMSVKAVRTRAVMLAFGAAVRFVRTATLYLMGGLVSAVTILGTIGMALEAWVNRWQKVAEEADKQRDRIDQLTASFQQLAATYDHTNEGTKEQTAAASEMRKEFLRLSEDNTSLANSFRLAADSIDAMTGALTDGGQAIEKLKADLYREKLEAMAAEAEAMAAKHQSAFGVLATILELLPTNMGKFGKLMDELFAGDAWYEKTLSWLSGIVSVWDYITGQVESLVDKQNEADKEAENFARRRLREMVELNQVDITRPWQEFRAYVDDLGTYTPEQVEILVAAYVAMQGASHAAKESISHVTKSLKEQRDLLADKVESDRENLDKLIDKYNELNFTVDSAGDDTTYLQNRADTYKAMQDQLDNYIENLQRLNQMEIKLVQEGAQEQIKVLDRQVKLGVKLKRDAELEKLQIATDAAYKEAEIKKEQARQLQKAIEQIGDPTKEDASKVEAAYAQAAEAANNAAKKRIEQAQKVKDFEIAMLVEFKDAAADAYSRAVDEAKKWADIVAENEKKALDDQKNTASILRDLRRMEMSEDAALQDRKRESQEKLNALRVEQKNMPKDATQGKYENLISELKALQQEFKGYADKEKFDSIRYARSGIIEIGQMIEEARSKATTAAKGELEKALENADKLRAVLDELKKPIDVNVKIDAGNVEEVIKQFEETMNKLIELGKASEDINLLAVVDPETNKQIDDLNTKLDELHKDIPIKVESDGAIEQVKKIENAIDKLPDKKVIEIQTVTTEAKAGGGPVGLAGGGRVPGYSPHSRADNILARLTAGEWVIQQPAVRYYGAGLISAINRGLINKNALLAAAAGSIKTRISQAVPSVINTVRSTMFPAPALPGFAVGGAVINPGNAIPDFVYFRYLNAMDQLAMAAEEAAAKSVDAAKLQGLVADRWGGLIGQINSAGFANGGLGLDGGTVNINLYGLTDDAFERQLNRVANKINMRRG